MQGFLIVLAILVILRYIYTYLKLSNSGYYITDFTEIFQEAIYGNKHYEVFEIVAELLFKSFVIYSLVVKNESLMTYISSLLEKEIQKN
jgi:hypothetical protein